MKYKVMFNYKDPTDPSGDEPLFVTANNKAEARSYARYYIKAWKIEATVGTIDRIEE